MSTSKVDKALAVTRKNFDKAAVKIIGREHVGLYKNPIDKMRAAAYIAFVEQPEKTNIRTKKYVAVLRETAKRVRKHGQFVWDKED